MKPSCLGLDRLEDSVKDCGYGSHVLARPGKVQDVVRSMHDVGVDLTRTCARTARAVMEV